jgi:hypothetical protein
LESTSVSLSRTVVALAAVTALMVGGIAFADPATPPPLPFKYLGKWTLKGRTTVLLERDHLPYAARLGQNLDREYRVDAIEADHLVLTYVPLGTRHVLTFSNEELPFVPLETATSPASEPLALTFSAPNHVGVDQDFLIGIGMRSSHGLSATATVDLSYDAALVTPVDGPGSGGRVSVRVNASGEEGALNNLAIVRFRVLTVNPVLTRIDINAHATDADGRALDIRAPETHALRIIP